ncbi:hypothetical protein L209DRAFT_192942 [Thermothelomyces heterothallicus CBS 203.75]
MRTIFVKAVLRNRGAALGVPPGSLPVRRSLTPEFRIGVGRHPGVRSFSRSGLTICRTKLLRSVGGDVQVQQSWSRQGQTNLAWNRHANYDVRAFPCLVPRSHRLEISQALISGHPQSSSSTPWLRATHRPSRSFVLAPMGCSRSILIQLFSELTSQSKLKAAGLASVVNVSSRSKWRPGGRNGAPIGAKGSSCYRIPPTLGHFNQLSW